MMICAILVICEDIVPTTLPFLLISTFTTNCYDSFDTFIGYISFAPLVLACFAFHFVVYHKKYSAGESIWGIFAISIAIIFGGIGNFTATEYLHGSYYFIGLSVGMAAAYFLMRSQFAVRRTYDLKERFAVIMLLMSALCALMIIIGYNRKVLGLTRFTPYPTGFSPNNISTMLMFAMPFPLYLARRKGRDWVAVLTAIVFGFLCIADSRGGLVFGVVEYIVCCVFWCANGRGKNKKLIRALICVGITTSVLLAFLVCGPLRDMINKNLLGGVVSTGETRYDMIFEAFDRFRKNPFAGSGILDGSISYGDFKKKGAMAWYHMMLPQIIGSMGIVGILAYGFQCLGRIKLIFQKRTVWSLCLGISYLGVLLMSQVNPGEFCPLPFELLTVLLFIFQEFRFENKPLWEKSVG